MFRLASYSLVAALCAASVPAYAQSNAAPLSEQSMVQAIQGLGYQPTKSPGTGAPAYYFSANAPWGGQVSLVVDIMKNQQGQFTHYIVSAVLSGPNGINSFDAGRLAALLKANFDALPCNFAVRKDGALILQMERNYNTINAQYLGSDIQALLRVAGNTRQLWAVGAAPLTGNTGPIGNPAPVNVSPVNVAPVNTGAISLANTVWKGTEQLQGFGALEFRFFADGKAVMVDAQSTVNGTYAIQGNMVAISLPGVATYTGTINGNTFTGQGKDDKGTWGFSVVKVQ